MALWFDEKKLKKKIFKLENQKYLRKIITFWRKIDLTNDQTTFIIGMIPITLLLMQWWGISEKSVIRIEPSFLFAGFV